MKIWPMSTARSMKRCASSVKTPTPPNGQPSLANGAGLSPRPKDNPCRQLTRSLPINWEAPAACSPTISIKSRAPSMVCPRTNRGLLGQEIGLPDDQLPKVTGDSGNLYQELLAKPFPLCLQFDHHRFTDGEVASSLRLVAKIHSRSPPRGGSNSMSIMVWHVIRRLPRPALLGIMIFVLTTIARA